MSNIVIGASEKSSVILPTHATQCVEEVCPYSTKNFTTACRSCQLASIDNLIGRGLPFTLSVTKKDYRRLCKLKYLRWSTDFLIPRPVYHTDADRFVVLVLMIGQHVARVHLHQLTTLLCKLLYTTEADITAVSQVKMISTRPICYFAKK